MKEKATITAEEPFPPRGRSWGKYVVIAVAAIVLISGVAVWIWYEKPPGINYVPTVTILEPTEGASWTGGTSHDVRIMASDDNDPQNTLGILLQYSFSGPQASYEEILNTTGLTFPFSFSWTAPRINSTEVFIRAMVVDPHGSRSSDSCGPIEIDSSKPELIDRYPSSGSTGISRTPPIVVTFSEPMNRESIKGNLTLLDFRSWTQLHGTYLWNVVGDKVAFLPDSSLDGETTYVLKLSSNVTDDSSPGNGIPSSFSWNFTTTGKLDTFAPAIETGPYLFPSNETNAKKVYLNVTFTDSGLGNSSIMEAEWWLLNGTTPPNISNGEGEPMQCADGAFGEPSELLSIPIDTSKMEDGSYDFWIHAKDAAGNWSAWERVHLTVLP